MPKIFFILFFYLGFCGFAQNELTHSVYFDLDKSEIKPDEMEKIIEFTKQIDTLRITSVNILGYCDDRGKDGYNYLLSENRANRIKDALIDHGVNRKIFVTIEGKGRILLENESVKNLEEIRSKNRRVDVTVKMHRKPQLFNWVRADHVVNDRVYLLNIYFERGSDILDDKSITELDKLVADLNKYSYLHFEIHGHVCCTPLSFKDAVNRYTKKRQLSIDRAKKVHDYLLKKGIKQERMTFKGFGNTRPLEGAKDNFNRRVELLITKTED